MSLGASFNRTCSIFSAQSSPHATGDQAAMGQRCSLERFPGAHLHLALSHLLHRRAGEGRAGWGGPRSQVWCLQLGLMQ